MKTSVIEVRDMLSVLTVDEVEKRIGEVPGVESATVNYAAGNATVRYDETRLEVADIKAIVHQRGHQPAGESVPEQDSEHETARKVAVAPGQEAAPAPAPTLASAAAPAPAAFKDEAPEAHEGHATPGAQPSVPAAAPAVAPAPQGHQDHHDHHAHMAADFRKRFWISLALTLPILVLSPLLQKLVGCAKPSAFPATSTSCLALPRRSFGMAAGRSSKACSRSSNPGSPE